MLTRLDPAPTADAIAALMIADLISADPDDLAATLAASNDDRDSLIATTFDDMRDDFAMIFDDRDFYPASLDPTITDRAHDLTRAALDRILA